MPKTPLIAIVDDDESLRLALVGLVRSLGYEASAYASADDYLASGQAGAADVVVTDIQMPGTSGIELRQKLADLGYSAPVIMITARTEATLHERASASGAFCLLKKPFPPERLIDCLERALTT